MKVFQYDFDVEWGNGCGFVVAENIDNAKELITGDNGISHLDKSNMKSLSITEIDLTKKEIYDFSWCE